MIWNALLGVVGGVAGGQLIGAILWKTDIHHAGDSIAIIGLLVDGALTGTLFEIAIGVLVRKLLDRSFTKRRRLYFSVLGGEIMAARGKPAHFRLATVCKTLNTTEKQLANTLGLSLAALKAIENRQVPLYLQLALTAMMDGLHPNPLFRKEKHEIDNESELVPLRLVR